MGSVRIQPMMDVRDGLTSQEMDIALQMLQTATRSSRVETHELTSSPEISK
jgi:hypothetical protein